MVRKAREIAIGDFKENCLAVIDDVRATGEDVVVTSHGTQVVRIAPAVTAGPVQSLRGSILYQGDLISPVIDWPAPEEE